MIKYPPPYKKTIVAFILFCIWNIDNLHAMENQHTHNVRLILLSLDTTPTDLHYAAQAGDIEKISTLLDNDADINSTKCHFNNTPIHVATWFGYHDCVTFLIKRGAKLDIPNCLGSMPTHSAAWKNELACLQELINSGAPIGTKNTTGTGNTELYLASKAGSTQCLHKLLEYNINKAHINLECAGDNSTAIQVAAARGRAQCYWELVVAGADYKRTIWFKNMEKKNSDMVCDNNPLKKFLQLIEYRGRHNPPNFNGMYKYCLLCREDFKHNDVVMAIRPSCHHTFHADCFQDYCVDYFIEKNTTDPHIAMLRKNSSDKEFAHSLKTNPFYHVELANTCPQCKKNFDPQYSVEFSVFLQ